MLRGWVSLQLAMNSIINYLNAALISFLIHASFFVYFYGINNFGNNSNLITKPVYIDLSFEIPAQKIKKESLPLVTNDLDNQASSNRDIVHETKTFPVIPVSNLDELINQEKAFDLNEKELAEAKFSVLITNNIEDAWKKPRNIPAGLVAHLRLVINKGGRIVKMDLAKSSGNFRFDSSALNAVRRVETFSFFKEIPEDLYSSTFRVVNVKFNPEKI